jgi:hypothetical protein
MGAYFSCGQYKSPRFKSKAAPVLAKLNAQEAKFTSDAQVHDRIARGYKQDSIKHFQNNEDLNARLSALKALENEAMAERYYKIVNYISSTRNHINMLGQQYDMVEACESNADGLQELKKIQRAYDKNKESKDETGKTVTEDDRLLLADEINEEFEKVISNMDTKIIRIQASKLDSTTVLDSDGDHKEIDHLIQRWQLEKGKPQAAKSKVASPEAMIMDETDCSGDEQQSE